MFEITCDEFKLKFAMDRRITILNGESGTGKTCMVQLLKAFTQGADYVNVTLPAKINSIVIADCTNWEAVISETSNSLIVFDNDPVIEESQFCNTIRQSIEQNNNFLLLIYRGELDASLDSKEYSCYFMKYLGDSCYSFVPADNSEIKRIPVF